MSVLFGYAESGNEVAEGVASLELVLVTLELIEVAAAATELAAAAEESEELSGLEHGSGVFRSYETR